MNIQKQSRLACVRCLMQRISTGVRKTLIKMTKKKKNPFCTRNLLAAKSGLYTRTLVERKPPQAGLRTRKLAAQGFTRYEGARYFLSKKKNGGARLNTRTALTAPIGRPSKRKKKQARSSTRTSYARARLRGIPVHRSRLGSHSSRRGWSPRYTHLV